MLSRDLRDILGGSLLVVLGLFFAVYSAANYKLGGFAQMGPGMLPLLLGLVLILLGFVIALIGFSRPGPAIRHDFRSLVAVAVAIAGFAVLSESFGMVPAVVVLTVGSTLADNKLSPLAIAGLTATLTGIAVGLFHFSLGIRMPLFAWPF